MPTRFLAALAVASAALLAPPPGVAEVTDSASNGFTAVHRAPIAAPPERVWQALTAELADWWHPDHTFSGDSSNLSIALTPGGCFCERLPDGGGVRHLQVVQFAPGRLLRLTGGLGPLQSLGVAGSLDIALAPQDGGTLMTWTYAVGGYVAGGLDAWAAPVDGVLGQQVARLVRWIETGSPVE